MMSDEEKAHYLTVARQNCRDMMYLALTFKQFNDLMVAVYAIANSSCEDEMRELAQEALWDIQRHKVAS